MYWEKISLVKQRNAMEGGSYRDTIDKTDKAGKCHIGTKQFRAILFADFSFYMSLKGRIYFVYEEGKEGDRK